MHIWKRVCHCFLISPKRFICREKKSTMRKEWQIKRCGVIVKYCDKYSEVLQIHQTDRQFTSKNSRLLTRGVLRHMNDPKTALTNPTSPVQQDTQLLLWLNIYSQYVWQLEMFRTYRSILSSVYKLCVGRCVHTLGRMDAPSNTQFSHTKPATHSL